MTTVFLDVDTQLDFMVPAGALYVPGAERLIPAIAELNRVAGERGIPLISTVDAHSEEDVEFRVWPHHCVAGALGQRKVGATAGSQRVFEKQVVDFGATDAFRGLVEELGAERWVVYGVVTEYCVKSAALALLAAGKQVEVVTDAIQSIDPAAGEAVLRAVVAGGGRLTTVEALLATDGRR